MNLRSGLVLILVVDGLYIQQVKTQSKYVKTFEGGQVKVIVWAALRKIVCLLIVFDDQSCFFG